MPPAGLRRTTEMKMSNFTNFTCPTDDTNGEKRMPKPKPVPTQGRPGAEPNFLSSDAAPD